MKPSSTVICVIVCSLVSITVTAWAAEDQRVGITGTITSNSAPPKVQIRQCDSGQFLVGISAQQTDRMIGFRAVCAQAPSYGVWKDSLAPGLALGDEKTGRVLSKSCPSSYFIVGLAATLGTYSADTKLMAHPVPPPLIADLQPVCRQLVEGSIYQLPRGYFEDAENNNLTDIAFDGLGSSHSCPAGEAAVGLAFVFNGQAGLDPANQFSDAALICERMPGIGPGISKGATEKAGKPKKRPIH